MKNDTSLTDEINKLKLKIKNLEEENTSLKQNEQRLINELKQKDKEINLLESKFLHRTGLSMVNNMPIPSNDSSVCSYINSKPPKTRLDLDSNSKTRQAFTKISPLSRTSAKHRDKTADDLRRLHERKLSDITRNKKLREHNRDKSSANISACSKDSTRLNITGSALNDTAKEIKTKKSKKSVQNNSIHFKKTNSNKCIIQKLLRGAEGEEIPYIFNNSELPFYNNNHNSNINIYSGRIDGEQSYSENKKNFGNSNIIMQKQPEPFFNEVSDSNVLRNRTNYNGQSFGIANLKIYGFPKK
jgi:hypothetical protein